MPSRPAWTKFGAWSPLGGANDSVTDWIRQALIQGALEGKTEGVNSISLRGGLGGLKIGAVVKAYYDAGGHMVSAYYWESWKNPHLWTLVWDDAFVNISWEQWENGINVHIEATSPERFTALRSIIEPHLTHDTRSRIQTICSTKAGLTTRDIGVGGADLVEANYTPDVIKDFRHVLADLNAKTPCGRISVFDGPPGTGKTYLVRALTQLVNAQFILLPAALISEISGPGLANVLLDIRKNGKDQPPMVLIVEDADEALVRRDAANMSAVSTLLNVGDGIFGTVLDIRIICTSNAGHLKTNDDLDPAIIRPGRLCRRISVGALSGGQATLRFFDLGGKGEPPWKDEDRVTIAEVYKAARGGDVVVGTAGKKAIGFGS